MGGVFNSAHAASASATASATIIAPVAIVTSTPQASPAPDKPTRIVIQSTGGLSGSGGTSASAGGSVSGSVEAASGDSDGSPNGYTITIDGDKTYAITMPPPIVVAEASAGQSDGGGTESARMNGGGLLAPHTQTVLIAGTLMASLSQAQASDAGGFTVVIEYN